MDVYIYICMVWVQIDFQTCMNIYIRLIIYSYFYLFKYSTNKHHRKLCIYTHRICNFAPLVFSEINIPCPVCIYIYLPTMI